MHMSDNLPELSNMTINPMQSAHSAKRCLAYARTTGKACMSPAMPNGKCRMHGGKSTGAPTGKANGNYKHGKQTQENLEFHRELRSLSKNSKAHNKAMNGHLKEMRQIANSLGVRWQKLFCLTLENDGGAALVSFIAKRLHKIEEKKQRACNH
jgi:glucans biosynthesis protein